MWQTKYASAVPKNLGVGVNFQPCSLGYSLGVHSPCSKVFLAELINSFRNIS